MKRHALNRGRNVVSPSITQSSRTQLFYRELSSAGRLSSSGYTPSASFTATYELLPGPLEDRADFGHRRTSGR